MFKFLAVDAYSSLVALGNTHLVSAALNLLTGVLGGVYIWEKIENEMYTVLSSLLHFFTFCCIFLCPSLYYSLPVSNPKSPPPLVQHNLSQSKLLERWRTVGLAL